jgi:hypothetical protein
MRSCPVCSGVMCCRCVVHVCCFVLQFSSIVGAVTPSGLLLLWPLLVLSLVHIVMGVVPGRPCVLFRHTRTLSAAAPCRHHQHCHAPQPTLTGCRQRSACYLTGCQNIQSAHTYYTSSRVHALYRMAIHQLKPLYYPHLCYGSA